MSNNDRVTIIAVGVGDYKYMKKLMEPIEDVKKLRELLVKNHDTAIYGKKHFIELTNPDSAKLREAIIEYTK